MPRMINTVNGLLSVDELGTTLMHEHILQANWSMRMSFKDWFDYGSFIEWAADDAIYNSRYIHRFALPMLRARGLKDREINRIMTENPRAYFGAD